MDAWQGGAAMILGNVRRVDFDHWHCKPEGLDDDLCILGAESVHVLERAVDQACANHVRVRQLGSRTLTVQVMGIKVSVRHSAKCPDAEL